MYLPDDVFDIIKLFLFSINCNLCNKKEQLYFGIDKWYCNKCWLDIIYERNYPYIVISLMMNIKRQDRLLTNTKTNQYYNELENSLFKNENNIPSIFLYKNRRYLNLLIKIIKENIKKPNYYSLQKSFNIII